MQMPSRIRHAWQSLAARVEGLEPGTPAFILALQEWLRTELGGVSRLAAAALPAAQGVQQVLAREATALPVSARAASELATALRAPPPSTNPEAFVREVDALCWRLAVFARDDDVCPRCQGDLELWTDGTVFFEHCTLLGCLFEAAGARVTSPPHGLRPATRAEVLQRFPGAVLSPW